MPYYVIGAFVILVGIIVFLLVNRQKMHTDLSAAYFILGYYKIRFGEVTIDDIVEGVGLPQEVKDKAK